MTAIISRILHRVLTVTSHKKFSEWKQAHVGMEPSKSNQTRWECPVSADGGRTVALRSALPRWDPDVQIEIPFDQLVYNGGLKQVGTFVWAFCGIKVYQIKTHNAEYGIM